MIAKNKKLKRLEGEEILYGFCGWLTTRDKRTVMSSGDDCGCIADLVKEFSEVNKLSECRDGWNKILIHPKK